MCFYICIQYLRMLQFPQSAPIPKYHLKTLPCVTVEAASSTAVCVFDNMKAFPSSYIGRADVKPPAPPPPHEWEGH
jgi:hypothetical protein